MTDITHCRLCAELKSNADLIEINKDPTTFNLDFKIYQCFQIQIEVDDKLPKSICSNCCDQVIRMHEFSEKIHKAQDVLKRIYIQLDDFKDIKDDWEYSQLDESANNIDTLVKIEQKDDDFDGDFNTNDVKNESDSDEKDDVPLRKLISPFEIKTKKLNKSKKGFKRESKSERIKHRPKLKEWDDYIWRCHDCPTEYKTVDELRDHYKDEHQKPVIYSCMECAKPYTKYDIFRRHVRNHMNKYKFRCNICEKYFSNKWDLTQHSQKHSDIRKFTCDTCGKCFKSQSTLHAHGRLHLPEGQKQFYECDVCQKKFNSSLGLVYHKQIHLDIKDAEAVCEQCGKAFKAKCLLMAHMNMHVEGTPYSCDQCDKSFKWIQGLNNHKNVIHNAVIYTCDLCGRKLGSKKTLNKHKLTHTSDFPYQCEYCSKGFRIKYGLKVHLRQHTGESPFACLECKHYFRNDSNFIKHLKGRHKLKNFSIANNHQYPFVNP